MKWYDRFYTKEEWVKKSTEIERGLYDRIKAVSYTHLDVYKRQLHNLTRVSRLPLVLSRSISEIYRGAKSNFSATCS